MKVVRREVDPPMDDFFQTMIVIRIIFLQEAGIIGNFGGRL